jgi:hypothetical protein
MRPSLTLFASGDALRDRKVAAGPQLTPKGVSYEETNAIPVRALGCHFALPARRDPPFDRYAARAPSCDVFIEAVDGSCAVHGTDSFPAGRSFEVRGSGAGSIREAIAAWSAKTEEKNGKRRKKARKNPGALRPSGLQRVFAGTSLDGGNLQPNRLPRNT